MTCSNAKVSKALILKAATNFVVYKQQKVKQVQEPYIQEAMQRTWWQKLLGKPARNRQQAIVYCKENHQWNDYGLCVYRGLNDETKLENLVDLCNLTEESCIMLSPADAAVVEKYL